MRRTAQWGALCVLALAAACSFSPAEPVDSTFTEDAGHNFVPPRDGGAGDDAGHDDAGTGRDGGVERDAGSGRDAGDVRDAGEVRDGGPRDAGETPDSGVERDGGAPRDGGPRDGGVPYPRLSNITFPPPAAMGMLNVPLNATCTIDTANLILSAGCPVVALAALPVQGTGWTAAVITVDEGTIAGTVEVIGNRPLIIVSEGDFRIRDTGFVNLSATGPVAGPGAGRDCNVNHSPQGTSSGCGGGGGGHAAAGAGGGASSLEPMDQTPGGIMLGASTSSRLQGGCRGGDGNPSGAGGGGGGALQITARGRILLEGTISVAGGGGSGGEFNGVVAGGAGGGAGGTVLLEADMVQTESDAYVNAQGGGGGQGALPPSSAGNGEAGADGVDDPTTAPLGGFIPSGGAPGGDGGRRPVVGLPTDGEDAMTGGEAGGGGGGSYGRFEAFGATSCALFNVTRVLAERIVNGGTGCL
ncbi:MAG: hypothetical protein RMA76_22660 [Deltaproteobacteria bacterium]|jgi:hypothetical protein